MNLKTLNGETSFLNSFSWEMLIKAFLQDIIKPPILPKIIENSDQDIINARFGKMFFNLESGGKSLNNFVNDMYNEQMQKEEDEDKAFADQMEAVPLEEPEPIKDEQVEAFVGNSESDIASDISENDIEEIIDSDTSNNI